MESSVCFQGQCLGFPVPDGQEVVLPSQESPRNLSLTSQLGLLKEWQCNFTPGLLLPTQPQAIYCSLEFFCATFVMQRSLRLLDWNCTQTAFTWRNTLMLVLSAVKGLPLKSTTMIIWVCTTKLRLTNAQTVADHSHLKPVSGNIFETEFARKAEF